MAMKVRCEQCCKKISIDEAFAGGMCRCPYCKAITRAGGGPREARAAARPDRPTSPGEPAVVPRERAAEPGAIPLAKPVLIQGVVALALVGLLVLLGAAAVVFSVVKARQPEATPPAAPAENPFAKAGPNVAGMEIAPPVVYVVDASSGMDGLYDAAGVIVRHSIRSLKQGEKFNLLLVREEGFERLSAGWVAAGPGREARAGKFVEARVPAGATELDRAVREAILLLPDTVVVIAAKGPTDPKRLARQAQPVRCAIYCLSLGSDTVPKTMEKLASATGGKCKALQTDEIAGWVEDLPPLP